MLVDLRLSAQVRVWTDSIVAFAIALRRGIGKKTTRGVEVLVVQDMPKTGRVNMRRVSGELNLANLFDERQDAARN